MTLLILGLALWILPHWMKRLAPEMRASWGDKAKGPLSLAMVLGIVLMVVGYRAAEGAFFWGRSPASFSPCQRMVAMAVPAPSSRITSFRPRTDASHCR